MGLSCLNTERRTKQTRPNWILQRGSTTHWAIRKLTAQKCRQNTVFSDIYRLAAAKLGVSPAEAQSLGWFGSGHRTGLASEMKTVVELIDDRIDVTSQIMNVDKETVFKGFMEGSIPLLSFGGAVLLGAGSEEDK